MPTDQDVEYAYPIDNSKAEAAIKTDVAAAFGLQESQVIVRAPGAEEAFSGVMGSYTRICGIKKEGFAESGDTVRAQAQT
jgi:hypothetical protein